MAPTPPTEPRVSKAEIRVWSLTGAMAIAAGAIVVFGMPRSAVAADVVQLDWWIFAIAFLAAELTVIHLPVRHVLGVGTGQAFRIETGERLTGCLGEQGLRPPQAEAARPGQP